MVGNKHSQTKIHSYMIRSTTQTFARLLWNFFGVGLSLTSSLMFHINFPILHQETIAPKLQAQKGEREKKRHKRDYNKQISSNSFTNLTWYQTVFSMISQTAFFSINKEEMMLYSVPGAFLATRKYKRPKKTWRSFYTGGRRVTEWLAHATGSRSTIGFSSNFRH